MSKQTLTPAEKLKIQKIKHKDGPSDWKGDSFKLKKEEKKKLSIPQQVLKDREKDLKKVRFLWEAEVIKEKILENLGKEVVLKAKLNMTSYLKNIKRCFNNYEKESN